MNKTYLLESTWKDNKIGGEGAKAMGKMLKINSTLCNLRFISLRFDMI